MTRQTTRAVRAPTWRSTYGLLVGAGAGILAIGLIVPFLVADPVTDQALTTGTPTEFGTVPTGPGENVSADPTNDSVAGNTTTTVSGPASPAPGAAGEGATATTAPSTGSEVHRTASDVGISPDIITVGIPIPDTSGLGDVEGGVEFGESIGDFRAQYQAAINDLNKRGGMHGRQIKPEYRLYDPVDPDSMRAACVYLTEEKKVFAVLGGFYGDPILCITEQHSTPLIAQASEHDGFYARSNGMYFSITATKDRIIGDLARSLHRDGALNGKTIGILDQEGVDAVPVDRSLIPTLKSLGYTVKYHARIANDIGAAQSQIPLEVQKMSGAGVDAIIVASGLIRATAFVQEAQNQRYRPQYLLSDFASGATNVYTIAMPEAFDGALGYTSLRTGEEKAGIGEAPHDQVCRTIYERETGRKLDRNKLEYYYGVTACGIVGLFERGMLAAGVNPTRAGLSQGLQGIGQFQVPFGAAGSFRPGKFDAPDSTRRVQWHYDCRCWIPLDDFRPAS